MRTTQVANYALRLNFNQVADVSGRSSMDKAIGRSAAVLAAFGIGLSTFSLKQMLATKPRRC